MFVQEINARSYTHLLPVQSEYQLQTGRNYLFELSYLSVIALHGEKSAEFLQGQVTADVRAVTSSHIRTSALCDLKGRILALLDITDINGLHLILPEDLSAQTQHILTKPALLSKVTINPASQWRVYGFFHQDNADLLPCPLPTDDYEVIHQHGYTCYRLAAKHYLILCPSEEVAHLTLPFKQAQQLRGSLLWHAMMLKIRRMEIYPASRGLFLPHRLSLQHTHVLNFNKGCYKGQEIIARTQYRAKLKHQLTLLIIPHHVLWHPGQRMLDAQTQTELGEVVDGGPLDSERYLLLASAIFDLPTHCVFEGQHTAIALQVVHEGSLN